MEQDPNATDTSTDSTALAGEATQAIDPPSAGLHELSKADRDSFYSTGKLPTKTTDTDDGADSSTAPSGEQSDATASKTAAASEPAKPAKDKKVARNADERVTELLTDRTRERDRADRAERELDAMKQRLSALEKPKQDAKADSSPAADPSQPEWKKFRGLPGAPKIADFTGEDALEDFIEAKALFIAKQISKEQVDGTLSARDQQSAEHAEAQRHMETVVNTAASRLEAEEKADPTLKDKVDPKFRALVPARFVPDGQAVGPHHYAKDFILFESEKPGALSVFYSSAEGQAEWQRMMTMPRRQLERTLIARELALGPSSQGGPASASAAAKTFTKTPAPPEHAGKKPAHVGDPVEKAVQKGDFREFMRGMDEREGVTSRYSR